MIKPSKGLFLIFVNVELAIAENAIPWCYFTGAVLGQAVIQAARLHWSNLNQTFSTVSSAWRREIKLHLFGPGEALDVCQVLYRKS